MVKEISPEKKSEKPKGRLQTPVWRFLSILVAFLSASVFLYSISKKMIIIPVATILFFLLLWLWPTFWTWLEEIFGKRPGSGWGRFSMNFAIATLIAITLEDIMEIFVKGVHILQYILSR